MIAKKITSLKRTTKISDNTGGKYKIPTKDKKAVVLAGESVTVVADVLVVGVNGVRAIAGACQVKVKVSLW